MWRFISVWQTSIVNKLFLFFSFGVQFSSVIKLEQGWILAESPNVGIFFDGKPIFQFKVSKRLSMCILPCVFWDCLFFCFVCSRVGSPVNWLLESYKIVLSSDYLDSRSGLLFYFIKCVVKLSSDECFLNLVCNLLLACVVSDLCGSKTNLILDMKIE